MKACLSFNDIIEVNQPQIQEMERVGRLHSNGDTTEACAAFTQQVRLAEGTVSQTYRLAASLARRTDELKEVEEIWKKLSQFCQSVLQVLAALKDKFPQCGTPELYDLILDYKLAADKRYQGVEEELACQKTDFPKGLLPDLN
jgi:hypothetical protein